MENVMNVTSFLRKKIIAAGGDPDRETLNVIPVKDGRNYLDNGEECWQIIRRKPDRRGDKTFSGRSQGDHL